MTNYNERSNTKDTVTLESILKSLAYKVEWCVSPELLSGATVDRDREGEAVNEAKQALTSLMKELVGEARLDEARRLDEMIGSPRKATANNAIMSRIAELKAQQEQLNDQL